MPRVVAITGTDTGVGKTVLTALLVRSLRGNGVKAAAIKPICSGGRSDARVLKSAAENALTLDTINRWHFRAPVAPLLAARKENQTIALLEVVTHVRTVAHNFDVVFVEGAGGLLSPMGDHFTTRELIGALGADVIVAARNQLGVINHVRLTLEALPPLVRVRARIALMGARHEDTATRSNAALLTELLGEGHVFSLPWFPRTNDLDKMLQTRGVKECLHALLH